METSHHPCVKSFINSSPGVEFQLTCILIQTLELSWVCQSAQIVNKKSSTLTVASLNICTLKNCTHVLLCCRHTSSTHGIVPFLSPSKNPLSIGEKKLGMLNQYCLKQPWSNWGLWLCVSLKKVFAFGPWEDFRGHSWPLHTPTHYYLKGHILH